MRHETVTILAMADAFKDYGRESLIADVEELISAKRFFTSAELAERYAVTGQTIANWEKDNILCPDLRVGKGCVRYSARVVAEFEKNHPGKRV